MSGLASETGESPQELCLRVYRETHGFYQRCRPKLSSPRGYTILYGPPVVGAPIFFVGENPGDRGGEPLKWGKTNGYGDTPPPWDLACKMQQIWPLDVLRRSTGLNMNFFHSRSSGDWLAVADQKKMKQDIEAFCRERVHLIIRALKPKTVVAYGKIAYEALAEDREVTVRGPGRGKGAPSLIPLVWLGKLNNDPSTRVFGTPHLSGRWTRPDADQTALMRNYFATVSWDT